MQAGPRRRFSARLRGLVMVCCVFGLFAPARTPPAIIEKIAREIRAVEEIPEVRKRIEGVYYRPVANTPAEFAELLRAEQVTWKRAGSR